jgi:tetratricopeptide (TPR) repeat protein
LKKNPRHAVVIPVFLKPPDLAGLSASISFHYPTSCAARQPQEFAVARQCAACKLESALDQVFHPVKGTTRTKYYCPECWERRQQAKAAEACIGTLAIAAMGLLGVILMPGFSLGWFMVNVALVFVIQLALLLPHEIGHALTGWLVGLRVIGIYLGRGKRLWVGRWRGFALVVNAIPTIGVTLVAEPGQRFFRARRFIMVLGGPAVNVAMLVAVFAAVPVGNLYPLERDPSRPFPSQVNDLLPHRLLPVADLVLANVIVLAINLWPRRFSWQGLVLYSDGLALVRTLFLSAEEVHKANALYFTLQGMSCLEDKRFLEAAEWCRRGLQDYPDNKPILSGLASANLHMGEYVAARQIWLRLLAPDTQDPLMRPAFLNNIAIADLLLIGTRPCAADPAAAGANADLLQEADHFAREACRHAPWVYQFKGTFGCVLVEKGLFQQGAALLRPILEKLRPPKDQAFAACYLGLAELRQGRVLEAKRFLDVARRLDPKCIALAIIAPELEKHQAQQSPASCPRSHEVS